MPARHDCGSTVTLGAHCAGHAGDIGNFERFVWFDRPTAARNPAYVRSQLTPKLYGFEPGTVPKQAFLDVDLSCITSWVQLTFFCIPKGAALVAHAPIGFLDMAYIPMAIVFKVNETTLGLNHNILTDAGACPH